MPSLPLRGSRPGLRSGKLKPPGSVVRILLDESLPRQLARHLPGHDVVDVHARGWSGKKNGELLALAAAEFDAFISADRNLKHQQNPSGLAIRIVVLAANTNRLADLLPLLPDALLLLKSLPEGEIAEIADRNNS
jgi:predicted nuclease of predicted toxin-antitoxin system